MIRGKLTSMGSSVMEMLARGDHSRLGNAGRHLLHQRRSSRRGQPRRARARSLATPRRACATFPTRSDLLDLYSSSLCRTTDGPLNVADRYRRVMAVRVSVNRSAGRCRVEIARPPLRLTRIDQRGRLARLELDVAREADELIRAGPADQGRVTLRPAVLTGFATAADQASYAGPGRC